MAATTSTGLAILRLKAVQADVSLSKSTIYQRIKEKTFPAAIPLGPRSVGWRRADVDAWLANPASYRAPEAK